MSPGVLGTAPAQPRHNLNGKSLDCNTKKHVLHGARKIDVRLIELSTSFPSEWCVFRDGTKMRPEAVEVSLCTHVSRVVCVVRYAREEEQRKGNGKK